MNSRPADIASSAKFHALLCAILIESCIQQSGHLSYDKSVFARLFRVIFMDYNSIYAQPWCFRMLQMCGMVGFLSSKLLCHPLLTQKEDRLSPKLQAQFLRKILRYGFNLETYMDCIRDPSRLQIFRNFHMGMVEKPYGVSMYENQIFMTNGKNIFFVHQSNQCLRVLRFLNIQDITLYGLYGIDIANDGTIAVAGYNNMMLYLVSQQCIEIMRVRIGNPLIHQQLNISGVCWTHNFQALLFFTGSCLIAMKRTGEYICQFGTKGSQPGSFRGEGQIQRLREPGYFLVLDCDNNRAQIVKIDLERQTLTVIRIFGYEDMFTPLGSAIFQNCMIMTSIRDNCLYFNDGSKITKQVLDNMFGSPRFAMSLSGGIVVVADTGNGRLLFLRENLRLPVSKETCLPGIFLDGTGSQPRIQNKNGEASTVPQTIAISDTSAQCEQFEKQTSTVSTQCEPFALQIAAVSDASARCEPLIPQTLTVSANELLIHQHYCNIM
jgi:hypothetical protein